MELLSFLLYSLIFLVAIHGFSLFRKRKLPPGPIGLPVIGNLLEIGSKPNQSLAKLAKKHGPLMTIRLGSITSVVASNPDMAREILKNQDEAFSGRTIPDVVTVLENYDLAVLWMPARDQWRVIRRALSIFLTHPQKLDTLRELRHKAVGELVQHIQEASKTNEAIGISKLAFTTALNQMSKTCFSVNVANFKSGDVQVFLNAIKTIMEIDGKFNVADIFPWLKPFDPQGMRRKAKATYGYLGEVCDGFVDQRLRHREANLERYGDLLDSFLDFCQENEAEFNCKIIRILLVELLIGGTETTTNTTEWAMTELILHPTIMEKLRREIIEKVGNKGRIEESEILQLPYLQAVVKETMRLHLAVPLLVPHKTETEVKLKGYIIPKNTQVLVNAWAIARDPDYWENPTSFIPERFLGGSEVDYRGQHFFFIPFGSGRRMCPGIALAQRMVSLMVASLVYHFEWKLPNGVTPENLDMDVTFGLTLQRATPLLAVPTILKERNVDEFV